MEPQNCMLSGSSFTIDATTEVLDKKRDELDRMTERVFYVEAHQAVMLQHNFLRFQILTVKD